jgi:hypothetical protein
MTTSKKQTGSAPKVSTDQNTAGRKNSETLDINSPSQQELRRQRHPSRPPLAENCLVLSEEKREQLRKHLNSGWQISPLRKKRSQT